MNPNRLSFTPKAVSFRLSMVVGALALLAASGIHAQTFSSGSTGADGAFAPTVNTEVVLPASGVLNYTSVSIPTGVTVTFKKNAANTPVYLLATENVTIAGLIDVRGQSAKNTGTYGDGLLGDDGVPGVGGAGGFDGGRGGREGATVSANSRGGAGMGPGGGSGGTEIANGNSCTSGYGYYKEVGTGGGHATTAYPNYSVQLCGSIAFKQIGKAYGSSLLQPLIGGSGGGGGAGGLSYPGSGGGGGGGALLIAATGTINLTGNVVAYGGDGGGVLGTGVGGQGAGGSGGAIRLVATTISGTGAINATGGCRQASNSARQGCGSDGQNGTFGGAPGRIRFEANAITFSGTVSPTQSVGQPGPVFIAGAPSLRIASVSGQTVPANPTGNADITLPATTTGPVDVTFETANVPVGNTVLLRVVPAYGLPTEVLSPALAGTAASGNATVSVTLPSGPSVLQATTTYTVVVAGTVDLSRFALNEAVDKVEVTVPLQGEPTARVITATGKSYVASYEALRAAGFKG